MEAHASNDERPNDEERSNLVSLVELLMEIDQLEKDRINRLKTEPNGFAIEAKGFICHGCSTMFFEVNKHTNPLTL
jgi:hypothetical protein